MLNEFKPTKFDTTKLKIKDLLDTKLKIEKSLNNIVGIAK